MRHKGEKSCVINMKAEFKRSRGRVRLTGIFGGREVKGSLLLPRSQVSKRSQGQGLLTGRFKGKEVRGFV